MDSTSTPNDSLGSHPEPEHGPALGDYLKQRRRALQLTQEDVTRRVDGLTLSYLQHLEQGRATNPSLDILTKLATALEIDWNALGRLAATAKKKAPKQPPRASRFQAWLNLPQQDREAFVAGRQHQPTPGDTDWSSLPDDATVQDAIFAIRDLHMLRLTQQGVKWVSITVLANDRAGLLSDLTEIISRQEIDLHYVHGCGLNGRGRILFAMDEQTPEKLGHLLAELEKVKDVIEATPFHAA